MDPRAALWLEAAYRLLIEQETAAAATESDDADGAAQTPEPVAAEQ